MNIPPELLKHYNNPQTIHLLEEFIQQQTGHRIDLTDDKSPTPHTNHFSYIDDSNTYDYSKGDRNGNI